MLEQILMETLYGGRPEAFVNEWEPLSCIMQTANVN